MTAAWFGIAGVLLGGLLSTSWSWLAIIRQELADGMASARVVDDDLASLEESRVGPDTNFPGHPAWQVWTEHRVALARVLGTTQWNTVSNFYRHHSKQPPNPEAEVLKQLSAARMALAPLVSGKRYVVRQRWANMLGR